MMWSKLHARISKLITPEKGPVNGPSSGLGALGNGSTRFIGLGPTLAAVLLICLCAILLYVRYPGNFKSYEMGPPGDFKVYLRAWERVNGGESPYVATDFSPYKYSPGVLGLIQVLPSAPVDAWFAFSTFCIVLFALALLAGARYRSWKDVLALGTGLGLAWKGILETLDYGQIEMLIFSIAIFSAATFARFTFFSGLLLGILPWLKLPWILLVVPFVLAASRMNSLSDAGEKKPPARRLRLFVSGFVFSSFIWGAAVPSLVFGPERAMSLSQAWLNVLKKQPPELFASNINQSLWVTSTRMLSRLFGASGGQSSLLSLAIPALIAATLLGLLIRRRPKTVSSQDTMSWLTPWMIFIQLVNPLSWRWGSVYLVGALFSSRRSQFAKSPLARNFLIEGVAVRPLLWGGVFVVWALQLNPVLRLMGIQHWTELHGYGVVTIYWFLILLLCL
ncbi:MAG: DUF2029 domain-containing protein [Methylotenera sp.]|nr:DUF2029 domain-containing protein [Oligoflexia bacterium]